VISTNRGATLATKVAAENTNLSAAAWTRDLLISRFQRFTQEKAMSRHEALRLSREGEQFTLCLSCGNERHSRTNKVAVFVKSPSPAPASGKKAIKAQPFQRVCQSHPCVPTRRFPRTVHVPMVCTAFLHTKSPKIANFKPPHPRHH
jgi:hypothetical protein